MVNKRGVSICFFVSLAIVQVASADEEVLEQVDSIGSQTVGSTPVGSTSVSTIEDSAFSGVTGITRVNLTAGDNNLQQNSAAVAASDGLSVAGIKAKQVNEIQAVNPNDVFSSSIKEDAFQESLGIVMVNQSAGAGNSQLNGAAIAIGETGAITFVQMDDASLAGQTTGNGVESDANGNTSRITPEATIDATAFKESRGVVLINQVAGSNNRTANTFTLTVNQ